MNSFASKSNWSEAWRNRFDSATLLTLSPRQASFDRRGFREGSAVAREALEAVGKTFIIGYNVAVRAASLDEVLGLVAGTPPQLRGFAAEGAAMGTAISDALPFRSPRFQRFLTLLERDFTYLVHVGAGWALARVPWRRRHILQTLDLLHHWLAFDGLGFHDCYFKTSKVLGGWRREPLGYAARAYDQGIGRALWFAGGGCAAWAADRIGRLAPERREDLFSGLGLAIAYAGPATSADVWQALQLAAPHGPHFAQGVAFACEARVRASCVPEHTRNAADALGYEASALAGMVCHARNSLLQQDEEPSYQAWRCKVADAFARLPDQRA